MLGNGSLYQLALELALAPGRAPTLLVSCITLQRPPPEILTFCSGSLPASSTTTRNSLDEAAWIAPKYPAAPPPITTNVCPGSARAPDMTNDAAAADVRRCAVGGDAAAVGRLWRTQQEKLCGAAASTAAAVKPCATDRQLQMTTRMAHGCFVKQGFGPPCWRCCLDQLRSRGMTLRAQDTAAQQQQQQQCLACPFVNSECF